ncbi:unnamed protein product [Polarella glacialis]|uniref:Uncharacterized protein n=1 Tax=Polarella glacialis TaxID=89957 RepID=A0A813HIT8_POLGL|nr:unnamed protein product [Polarella glacialis]
MSVPIELNPHGKLREIPTTKVSSYLGSQLTLQQPSTPQFVNRTPCPPKGQLSVPTELNPHGKLREIPTTKVSSYLGSQLTLQPQQQQQQQPSTPLRLLAPASPRATVRRMQ